MTETSVTTSISIILPTYNEAENIAEMVEWVEVELAGDDFEIIVVDDDSPDGTSEIVTRLCDRFDNLRLITRTSDRGLVQSINEGIHESRYDVCVWMDADLSMPATTIKQLVREIEQGADIAVGSRYVKGGGIKGAGHDARKRNIYRIWRNLKETEDSFIAVAVSVIGNQLVRHLLDRNYHDYTSGFYAVKKGVFSRIKLEGKYLDYCIRFMYGAVKSGYKVVEVPVVIAPRERGHSKTASNPLHIIPHVYDCLRTVYELISQNKKGS